MDNDPTVSILYFGAGTFQIGSSVTLNKPVIADAGAVLNIAGGTTITIVNQPEHPLTTFFTGAG